MAEELRAVDANVVLRYLLADVPDQAARARRLIDSGAPVGLTAVALAEVAWTMTTTRYKRDRQLAARALLRLLGRENVIPLGFGRAAMQNALDLCTAESGAPDFGDALIAASALEAGVTQIYSFDRDFGRAGLIPVPPP